MKEPLPTSRFGERTQISWTEWSWTKAFTRKTRLVEKERTEERKKEERERETLYSERKKHAEVEKSLRAVISSSATRLDSTRSVNVNVNVSFPLFQVRRKSKSYGQLVEGDEILSIGGKSVEGLSHDEAMALVDSHADQLNLSLKR